MSLEENRAIVRRFTEEVINRGDLAAIERYVATSYLDHTADAGQAVGAEGLKQRMAMARSAFPDLHLAIDDLIAEGDQVVARVTVSGTHRGEYMGILPTGRPFEIIEIHIVRVVRGKLVEHWGINDHMGLMQQLGVAPAQG